MHASSPPHLLPARIRTHMHMHTPSPRSAVYDVDFGGTRVAVRRFFESSCSSSAFVREALLLSELRHPNIVQLIKVACRPPLCIVTELLVCSLHGLLHQGQGGALRPTLLAAGTPMLTLCTHIARGLNYLHTLDPPVLQCVCPIATRGPDQPIVSTCPMDAGSVWLTPLGPSPVLAAATSSRKTCSSTKEARSRSPTSGGDASRPLMRARLSSKGGNGSRRRSSEGASLPVGLAFGGRVGRG